MLRRRILRRDSGLCQICEKSGRFSLASEVDHIIPLSKGGSDDEDNLQSICRSCHDDKTRTDLGMKAKTAIDASGLPLSPGHHWNV
jgi:5-methylcytosine-specific restriction endonuclease McrA